MKHLTLTSLTSLILFSCSNNDDSAVKVNDAFCDFTTVISADLYNNTSSEAVTIEPNRLSISGDCLTITYLASGCNGNTWNETLYDADVIMESIPVQRNIRLSITNEELCNTIVTKESSFDISNLQVEGTNSIILNITNYPETYTILYEY